VNGRTPIFAANWKMNKMVSEVEAYVSDLSKRLSAGPRKPGKDYQVLVAPPATHLQTLVRVAAGKAIEPCAQNCGTEKAGAFTGEISPAVLKEIGCNWTLLGHSERRHVFKETDEMVAKRMKAALAEGLKVVLCVGEKIEERRAQRTFDVVGTQLYILKQLMTDNAWPSLVVAYEPVWAIGTGETATPEQAQEVHAFIRGWFSEQGWSRQAADLRLLYGGSVNPANSASLMEKSDVDGLLVGGASLDSGKFAELTLNGLGSYA
jgi:triosephosphate isomerase (TIM)